jgi:ribose-phosphate pyrophosphokinase
MERKQIEEERLRLMVFKSALELGKKVDEHLLRMYGLDKKKFTFILPIKEDFFEDGHLKVEIGSTVRGKNVFTLTDIGNYSLTYNMHGFENHTSPNDLMAELKDGIGACDMHAGHINVVMPLLYDGRQHRRNTRECLSCGAMLHELDSIECVRSFITFDAHDQGVEHAVHRMEFDNFYPTNEILTDFIHDVDIERLRNLVFVAPDNGATGRRNVYLNSFASPYIHREAGSFVKQRDYNHLVDGKYPVIAHDYCGNAALDGFTALISDDMISSGGSMFDTVVELRKRGVKHCYIFVTYALFTRGVDKFDEFYEQGLIDGVYTTNLSYIPEEYKKKPWLHISDCSKLVAQVIYNIHNDLSISEILRDKSKPVRLLEKKFKGVNKG